MAGFKKNADELKQRLRRAKQKARARASGGTRINISGRTNIQTAINIGRDGGEAHAPP